jgi:hypothetical protein
MKEEISLGELIVLGLKFIKKNSILFGVALLIGIGIGYFKEKRLIPTHTSEAVICSDLLEGKRLKEIISDFGTSVSQGNYSFLAKALDISIDSASQIKNITIEVIEPEINYRTDVDLTHSKLHHCIKVTCKSTSLPIYQTLEEKTLQTFENHPEVKQIVDQRKSGYKENIEQIKNDIIFLNEQRVKTYNKLLQGNSNIDINQFDNEGQFIFAYEKITVLEELYLRTKAAVLLKPFNKMTVAKHSKTKGIAVMAIMFLGIAFAIALFREIKV